MSKGNTISKSRTYTYDSSNGLLSSRTMPGGKMVQYTYDAFGSTSHPHAVTEVDNTDGSIGHNYQEVSYDSWGKIRSAWSYDPNDFYYYSVEYGPDQQRVWTQLDKTYNIEYSKYYWDDYEEKTTGSLTTRYWYINGPDGLIGIYIEEQTPSGTVSIPTVAATDHLGSIQGLFGNNNYCYYAARYDEWGDRDVMLLYGLSHGFDRGYTGHEHIDELGLINMNGRMYDPNLGRFLSPDPFVQAPSNPQNFNRYSYCLNNPLKYTDPTGELFGIDDLICAAAIGAIINVTMQGCANRINSIGDYLKAFGVGALSGALGALAGGTVTTYVPVGGFWGGAAIGTTSGFTSGFILGTGNALINKTGKAFSTGWDYGWKSALTGCITGGIMGGIVDMMQDHCFWNGKDPNSYIEEFGISAVPQEQNTIIYDSKIAEQNDINLRKMISNLFGVKRGDWNINDFTTRPSGGYKITEDNVFLSRDGKYLVNGYNEYKNGRSKIHISPYLVDSDNVTFKATVGHELIYAYHHYSISNYMKLASERVAYLYSFSTFLYNNHYEEAFNQMWNAMRNSYWGASLSEYYNLPSIFGIR